MNSSFPEEYKMWTDYLAMSKEFDTFITDLLIVNIDRRMKYVKIHDVSSRGIRARVYLQRKTNKIVKVVINSSLDFDQYQTQVVDIVADDIAINNKLTESTYVSGMTTLIEELREITCANHIVAKLTFGL